MHQFAAYRQNELPLGINIRPRLLLSEIERLIKGHRIRVPCPSRQTLIRMCEDGTLSGKIVRGAWEVYEDSFWSWANADEMPIAA
jgi:hypothetical protein